MNYTITIGRQFGSGGAEIGALLADMLGASFFDKEALMSAAEKEGISRDAFEQADERATSSFLYSLAMSSYSGQVSIGTNELTLGDRVYAVQSKEIKRLAGEGSAVFIGRCADDILDGAAGLVKIFIHAPIEERVKRVAPLLSLSEQNAKKLILKTDKKRASYYNFYTSKDWGDARNYHISIDSSLYGVEKSAAALKAFIQASNS